jgi:integrase
MVKRRERELAEARRRLNDASIAEEDRDLLEKLDTILERDTDRGAARHAQILEYALTIANYRSLPTDKDIPIHGLSLREILDSEDALDALLDWLDKRTVTRNGREKPLSDRSKTHYHSVVRAMGAELTDGDGRPPHIEALPATVHDTGDPTPHPSEILHWDDHVCQILDHPDVPERGQALAALAWDSGGRSWEIDDLVWQDIEDKGDYLQLTIVDGKTGDRTHRLVASMPYVKQWMQEHPIHDALEDGVDVPPDTPLWSHLDSPAQLKTVQERARNLSDIAGLERATNLRRFRKSRASILAMNPEVSEQALRYRFGWSPKSDAPAHYKATFGTQAEDQIASADGVDLELADEHEDPAPVRCPTCDSWTPRHLDECLSCNTGIDVEAAEENTAAEASEDVELREKQREFLAMIGRGDISPEIIRRVEPFAGVIDDDPDLTDKAEMFLKELEDD